MVSPDFFTPPRAAMAAAARGRARGPAAGTEGKAMENGREGDYINVKNLASGKVVRGKVIDKNNVEISR